ncbi:MAG TPA: DUF4344 domain-containing metallopeptidase [Longimicrobium sp.]|nr:DUF4344 domain-containing metallopeptidase [Longimicrobium sp.]
MKKTFPPVYRAIFVLLLLAVVAPRPVAAQQGWRVELGEAQAPESVHVRQFLEENRLFAGPQAGLNHWIRMPRPVTLHARECATSDVRWVPEQSSVEICYRLLVRLAGLLNASDSTASALTPSFFFFVLHGAAHAIVDELNLPTAAGEERAVDEVLALILVPHGGQRGSRILSGVQTLQRVDAGWNEWEYAQTHQLTPARIETIACLAYGANPSAFPEYRRTGLVPAARASGCPAAYQRVYNGLGQRLARHMN